MTPDKITTQVFICVILALTATFIKSAQYFTEKTSNLILFAVLAYAILLLILCVREMLKAGRSWKDGK